MGRFSFGSVDGGVVLKCGVWLVVFFFVNSPRGWGYNKEEEDVEEEVVTVLGQATDAFAYAPAIQQLA